MISLTNKSACSGCYCCVNVCPKSCISMLADSEGFLYPSVDRTACVDCGLCEKHCPVLRREKKEDAAMAPKAFAAYCTDRDIRGQSSSGGIFTLLAEQVIGLGGVVFGAGYDYDFQVVHSYAENKEQLKKFQGSKYVQSKIGLTYVRAKEFLEKGRTVLFTGTPCQIGGLRAYLGKDYDNLLCQDLICHGVPSEKVFRKYITYRKIQAGASPESLSFRDKSYGWLQFSMSIHYKNGLSSCDTLDKDPMMQAFLHNLCLRPSCYRCRFKGLPRQSDITLADFWGIEKIDPEMFDDRGTSLVLVNTAKGAAFWQSVTGKMVLKAENLEKAAVHNPSLLKPAGQPACRANFFSKLDTWDFGKLVGKYAVDSPMTIFKRNIRYGLSIPNKLILKVSARH